MKFSKTQISRILQVTVGVALALFIALTIWNVQLLQGTARVINYAGIARGATQRLVKLEVVNQPNPVLEARLDVILKELKDGGTVNQLIRLSDENYQSCLEEQVAYWETLKEEIKQVRSSGYEQSNIIEVSETYFALSDSTVTAAEKYSDSIAKVIALCEYSMVVLIGAMLAVFIYSYALASEIAKRKENSIRYQAEHDALTELLNRRSFEKMLKFYEEGDGVFALHLVDVDMFKQFNDAYGHSTGDEVLKRVANALKKHYRSGDFLCRIGGDEFAIVMVNTDSELQYEAESRLIDLKESLSKPEGDIPPITISVGVAFSDTVPDNISVFDAADQALYRVKEQGRNGYAFAEYPKRDKEEGHTGDKHRGKPF